MNKISAGDKAAPSRGGILLLTGPSGCGKTATVLVLCRELGFRIQEWINPTNMEPYGSSQHDWRTNGFSGFSCGSQVAQFQEFLLRANKYSCLRMAGDDGATDRKLILVEDLPNQFYRQPGSLHSNLRHVIGKAVEDEEGQTCEFSGQSVFQKEPEEDQVQTDEGAGRGGNPEGAEAAEVASGPGLSSHLSHHLRETLLVDPELVVERSHMSGGFFNLYLHQNYLDFFSEVEDVARASEYLSDSDLLTADWTSRSTMEDYGSSVATRGLLHSNSQQVSVGFRPLHKPGWHLVSKKHRENCLAAQSLFRSFCLTPVSLQTDLLPYLAKLSSPMRNQAQIAFIQDVGQMSQRRFSSRLKLEALTDKELGQLETDVEEEEEQKEEGQGGAEEGLPDSQPQPNTSQVLLEELDLIIEEYLSD
ncbi:hypothetical protein F2P81_013405 [Scophthalmus maximus]|uniref:AAA+ ATPase domain-containing protein n=1 Tax=Scophthalmus maximus TaxID=52904 RepID=A0A6A4SL71_SCOMX|nr:hypothetical protein F2P81_013405 [Scophthalmus maximus]